ncbi:Fanconi anemia complex, subunit FancL, WD-repeat containing domain protein [Phascolomyces articulosus]|uniref:Fanconi anemia complex, subunit FancL, WD-repeat containing domain protein n=1 Tax=Phascolomyces articulosus TaxID=60185 RepID=A0AAD5K4K0_9FUNG|nr:Fanconi anemia complex, subunit FancL, WD-repeat containing domain protein [Phascolomyces articulosus]
MALQRFPLMTPVDGEGKMFRGFFHVNNDEYFVEVHLPENNQNARVYGDSGLRYVLQEINEQELMNRLNQCEDITLFLSELKTILEEHGATHKNNDALKFSTVKRYKALMSELKEIGFDKVSHVNDAFDTIKFEISDQGRIYIVQAHIPSTYPLTPIKMILDGPSHHDSPPPTTTMMTMVHQEKGSTTTIHPTLHAAMQYCDEWIEIYRDYFVCMDELDQKTRILDPDQPMGKDTWRRIALKGHCSLHLELDPKYPRTGLKAMRFYGSDKNMKSFQQLWENQAHHWDNHHSPYENLRRIFGAQLMPKVSNDQQTDTSTDVECAICYAYKLEHEELGLLTPDVICTNDQCNRGFHPSCVSEVNKIDSNI